MTVLQPAATTLPPLPVGLITVNPPEPGCALTVVSAPVGGIGVGAVEGGGAGATVPGGGSEEGHASCASTDEPTLSVAATVSELTSEGAKRDAGIDASKVERRALKQVPRQRGRLGARCASTPNFEFAFDISSMFRAIRRDRWPPLVCQPCRGGTLVTGVCVTATLPARRA